MFSDQWMQDNGFWEGKETRVIKIKEVLGNKKDLPPLISVTPQEKLIRAIALVQEFSISQLPVIENGKIIGSLNEASLMKFLLDGIEPEHQDIAGVMGKPLPALDENTDIFEAYRILLSGTSGIVVTKNDEPQAIITRTDLVNYWIKNRKGDDYGI
jgi:cystathionine beta-synthase